MTPNKIEKRKNFIIHIVFLAMVLFLGYLALEYVIGWVMPFILGFIVSLAFRPIVNFLDKKTPLGKRFCAFLVVVLGYVLLSLFLWLIGDALFQNIKEFFLNLPTFYIEEINPFLSTANQGLLDFAGRFSPDFADQIGKVITASMASLQESLIDISANTLSSLASASTKLPLLLISLIFTILSSLFISMDFDHVIDFLKRQIPDKNKEMLLDIKSYLFTTLSSYLRAYLILMCITFIELSVGLFILRTKNPFGVSALIAITDAFPLLGTGTILIPWAIISLFQQRYYLSLGLFALYLIVTAVRQFIEPKIIGDQLGIPPVVAIIGIYLGFVWFGIWGAILFPVIMNIVIRLHRAGKIKIWK